MFMVHRHSVCSRIPRFDLPKATPLVITSKRHYHVHQSKRPNKPNVLKCYAAAAKAKFSSFNDLVNQSEFVLIDFYATWCGPCHMMSQILEDVSKFTKHVKFAKVDTERYPNIASKYGVHALPTLVLFHKGHVIDRFEGVLDAADLQRWISHAVAKKDSQSPTASATSV